VQNAIDEQKIKL